MARSSICGSQALILTSRRPRIASATFTAIDASMAVHAIGFELDTTQNNRSRSHRAANAA
jgi:hypothetical protein